jgi:hypothetical protein
MMLLGDAGESSFLNCHEWPVRCEKIATGTITLVVNHRNLSESTLNPIIINPRPPGLPSSRNQPFMAGSPPELGLEPAAMDRGFAWTSSQSILE